MVWFAEGIVWHRLAQRNDEIIVDLISVRAFDTPHALVLVWRPLSAKTVAKNQKASDSVGAATEPGAPAIKSTRCRQICTVARRVASRASGPG